MSESRATRVARLSLLRHRLLVLHQLYEETLAQLKRLELEMFSYGEIKDKDMS